MWIETGYTDPDTGQWIDQSYEDGVDNSTQVYDTDNSAWDQLQQETIANNAADQAAVDAQTEEVLAGMGQTEGTGEVKSALSSMSLQAVKALKDKFALPGGGTDWLKVGAAALSGAAALKAYQQAAAGVPKTGYQGGIPTYNATREQLNPTGIAGIRPGAGGQRYFTDTAYSIPANLADTQARIATEKTGLEAQNLRHQRVQAAQTPAALTSEQQQAASDKFYGRVSAPAPAPAAAQPAAQEGIMGLAHGGSTTKPGGTYLQGSTDGMADKIHATIDGGQPARLAHGEFVIPADVVSHLGNGNSDAGAKQLYHMMDKIRKARTGTTKQGKQINPEKFAPGGIAGYAAGGHIPGYAGTTDGSVVGAGAGVTGTESNLSNWAGPYVTDMLARGQALATEPYQAYQGPLTAGASDLQTQAFGNAANLATPASIGTAANTAGDVAQKMGDLSYSPTTATNQFTAPGTYQPTTATNQFTAPGAYDASTISSGTFGNEQAQQYMNPYLQSSLDPQLAEARRQAEVSRIQQAGQMTRAGAFGGSRQAISESEGYRNLGTNLANITGQGYNTAFAQAQQQFNADQARKLQGAQSTEQSKQFGASQGLTAAQAAAQYGQTAQAQTEQSKQFGASQGLATAGQTAQYGQAAQAQNEQAGQFGANYGLQGLQGQLSAAQTQGQLGTTQNATGLANLQAQLGAGAQQRDITQQGITADQAAFNAERDNPYKMVQYQQSLLQGLPLAAQSYSITNNPITAAAGAASTINTALGGK